MRLQAESVGGKTQMQGVSAPSPKQQSCFDSPSRGELDTCGNSKDYFTLFALEPSFAVDTTALQRSYIKLQQQLHPDRFANRPDQEKTLALQQSMTVNEAYNTLKDPFKRGEYLLLLQEIQVKEGQGSVKPSQETLMAMMELRERLEEATTPEDIQSIAAEVAEGKTALLSALSVYFAAGDYDQAAQGVIQLRYFDKTADEVKLRQRQSSC